MAATSGIGVPPPAAPKTPTGAPQQPSPQTAMAPPSSGQQATPSERIDQLFGALPLFGALLPPAAAPRQAPTPASTALPAGQTPSVVPQPPLLQTAKRIPLQLSGNSYTVPVLINGSIWLDFVIDTGASDVSIPSDVATTLMRTGTITKEDIGDELSYGLANGETVKKTEFRIHSLQIGKGDNAVIKQNVTGSIGGPHASLLLGQSFLRLFGSTTIDHVNSVLIVDASESQPPAQTAVQPPPAPAPVLQPAPALQPPPSAVAQPPKTYLFMHSASCEKSYSIHGAQSDNLTKQAGRPIRCDSLVLSLLDNGHVLLQIVDNDSNLTPTGFGASRLDYDANPNFITMPLERIYLPHSDPSKRETISSGVEGFCFLDGKLDFRALKGVSCAAKVELGTQKLVYSINVRVTGLGLPVK